MCVKRRHLANENFHSNRIGGGLEKTYAVHLWLIGKLVGDFVLVIIELFFARCFRFVTIHAFDRRTDVDSKVRSNEVRCAQKARLCIMLVGGMPSIERQYYVNVVYEER